MLPKTYACATHEKLFLFLIEIQQNLTNKSWNTLNITLPLTATTKQNCTLGLPKSFSIFLSRCYEMLTKLRKKKGTVKKIQWITASTVDIILIVNIFLIVEFALNPVFKKKC